MSIAVDDYPDDQIRICELCGEVYPRLLGGEVYCSQTCSRVAFAAQFATPRAGEEGK
jgi:hypothetical protein